jgi:hypothetical protein
MPKGVYQRPTIKDRFWAKVHKTEGCWEWTGARFRSGLPYGMFQMNGRPHLAHRIAWLLTHGEPESEVLHHCDNPPCVRPDHLFEGTPAINNADMMAKGRHRSGNTSRTAAKGESHGRARLTEPQIREIRNKRADGVSVKQICQEYSIARSTVWFIASKRRWASVT